MLSVIPIISEAGTCQENILHVLQVYSRAFRIRRELAGYVRYFPLFMRGIVL